jgi:hypothetical protein
VGCPLFSSSYQTETDGKEENFGQFDLHWHQLNWFRDNFSFASGFA